MFLFKVEDTFQITGRGLVLVPGLGQNADRVKVGMPIKLKKRDHTEIATKILSIEILVTNSPVEFSPIVLPKEIRKEDIPIGTEVWLDN